MVDLPRRLAYVPLEELRPAVDNGDRIHDLPAVIAAIRDLGFNDPLFTDDRTGRLVSGHGRVEALVQMQLDGMPCPEGIVVDDDGGWLVPVVRGWDSKTDARATAQLLAFNQLPENGRYNDYGLARLLEQVATDDAALLDATGFDADRLDDLLRTVNPERLGDQEDETDLFPETDGERPDDGKGQPDVLDDEREPHQVECPSCGHRFAKAAG